MSSFPLDHLVVVEGNIGAGKTTLLEEFARKYPNYTCLSEPIEEFTRFKKRDGGFLNPLEIFYDDPCNSVLTQLYFLDVYQKKAEELERQKTSNVVLCDRWMTSCKVFTDALCLQGHINSFGEEYFLRKYSLLSQSLTYAKPSGIFFLDTPKQECLSRLWKRGRAMEADFSDMASHLESLEISYGKMIKDYNGQCPIHISKGQTTMELVSELKNFIDNL